MHFYRALNQIKALSFDLDDTLYDNRPVLAQAEQQTLNFLRQQHEVFLSMELADIKQLRSDILKQQPEIYHNVDEWRRLSIYQFLRSIGEAEKLSDRIATEMMACFFHWRSQIDVPQTTHQTLERLAANSPLVAITNGNAEPAKFGIEHYFQFILKSGVNGRSKPYADMFDETVKRLKLPAGAILHVGDDLTTDVTGAINNGFMACWTNDRGRDLFTDRETRVLPDVEISQLALLQQLL